MEINLIRAVANGDSSLARSYYRPTTDFDKAFDLTLISNDAGKTTTCLEVLMFHSKIHQ